MEDTGIGMPKGSAEYLFRSFAQLDSSVNRRFGGTGLGLAICKRLTDRMGGTIGVESELGKGSIFRFSVAAALPDVPSPPLAADAENADNNAGLPECMLNILLAEDNATNQFVITRMLQSLGHTVTVVSDGAAAIDAVQEQPFDLVLMDVMMPEIDGLAATRAIRHLSGDARSTYIIALTANATSQDREQCTLAGMDDFMTKPVTRDVLGAGILRYHRSGHGKKIKAQSEREKDFDTKMFGRLSADIGGDSARNAIEVFFSDTARRIDKIRVGITAGNLAAVQREAHAIKSSAAALGLSRLSNAAGELEKRAANGDPDQGTRILADLPEVFARAKQAASSALHSKPETV